MGPGNLQIYLSFTFNNYKYVILTTKIYFLGKTFSFTYFKTRTFYKKNNNKES